MIDPLADACTREGLYQIQVEYLLFKKAGGEKSLYEPSRIALKSNGSA